MQTPRPTIASSSLHRHRPILFAIPLSIRASPSAEPGFLVPSLTALSSKFLSVIEGQGWFLGFHVFTRYVKVAFFRGSSLRPVPPGGTGKDARWIDIHEDDLDEAQMATWTKQASSNPGWDTGNGSLRRRT